MTPEPARPQQAKKAAPAQIVDCLGRDVPRRCCRRFPPRQHGHQPLGARQELRAGGSNVGRAGWRVGRQFWHIGWTLLTSDQRALQDEQMRLALLPTGSDGVSVTYCLVPSSEICTTCAPCHSGPASTCGGICFAATLSVQQHIYLSSPDRISDAPALSSVALSRRQQHFVYAGS